MSSLHKPENTLRIPGKPPGASKGVLILLHGRGATAANILSLAEELDLDDFSFLAPQATQNSWYPYSFLAPVDQNEPGLSSALAVVAALVDELLAGGWSSRQIYLLGFSQGACLAAEFCARNARPYGGIFILTGGLIGERVEPGRYQGNFDGCPVFFGSGDQDPHVPEDRVLESADLFRELGARVTLKIYPNLPHTVNADEIQWVKKIIA